jgi:hypothetical protein
VRALIVRPNKLLQFFDNNKTKLRKRHMIKYMTLTLAAIMLTSCSSTLDIAGVKYRKQGAFKAELGIAGVKRTNGVNGFDPKEQPIYGDKLLMKFRTELYNESTQKTAVSVAGKLQNPEVELNLKADSSSNEKGRFVVMEIMNPLEAARRLNDPANDEIRNYLSLVKRPRVITSVAIAYDYARMKELKFDGSTKVPLKQIGADASMAVTTSNNKTIRVSDGTIFAYEFSRIIWRKNGDKLEIFDLVPDRVAMDREIPAGMSDDPTKLK